MTARETAGSCKARELVMRLVVVEHSGAWSDRDVRGGRGSADTVSVEDVEAEANRRLKLAQLPQWRTREFVTGTPMPTAVRHYALQVEFAAKAIARLSPIPDDFDSDVYWPKLWG
jgi:hypothetical protein